MVKKWAADFKRDRNSLEDGPRRGRPAAVTTQKIIDKIHDMLLTDRRLTKRYIATALGISEECVNAIIHNHLEMTKVSARWVPKLLGDEQKRLRYNMSKKNLVIFDFDPERFIRQFVTIDETLITTSSLSQKNNQSNGSIMDFQLQRRSSH